MLKQQMYELESFPARRSIITDYAIDREPAMENSPASRAAALFLGALLNPVLAAAVPPPPALLTADCDTPSYASDMLVCEDSALLTLDSLLARLITERREPADVSVGGETDEEWFRRSRMCAFQADHRGCLVEAYCARIVVLKPAIGVAEPELARLCPEPLSGYLPAAVIVESGFARDRAQLQALEGSEVRLWGYVDQQNLYGDDAAKKILGDWWSGYGPDTVTWRFNLKAEADDPVGKSFPVHVPNDPGRDELLRLFMADAVAGRQTRVYVQGRVFTFEAPTMGGTLTGLRLELRSSQAIRRASPVPD